MSTVVKIKKIDTKTWNLSERIWVVSYSLAGAVEGLAITQENTTQENKHDITQENTAANARTSVRELTAERSDVFNQTSNSENVSQNKCEYSRYSYSDSRFG